MFSLSAGAACAATAKCTVTEIKDNVVTLDCGTTAAKIVAGDVVKVKTAKKKAIEGC
jgi:hypothetical protein